MTRNDCLPKVVCLSLENSELEGCFQTPGRGNVFKTDMSEVIFLLEEISQCAPAHPLMRMSPFLRRLVGENYKFPHGIVSLGLDLLVYIL